MGCDVPAAATLGIAIQPMEQLMQRQGHARQPPIDTLQDALVAYKDAHCGGEIVATKQSAGIRLASTDCATKSDITVKARVIDMDDAAHRKISCRLAKYHALGSLYQHQLAFAQVLKTCEHRAARYSVQ